VCREARPSIAGVMVLNIRRISSLNSATECMRTVLSCFHRRVVALGQVRSYGRPDEMSMMSRPQWKLVIQDTTHVSSIMGWGLVLLQKLHCLEGRHYGVLELSNETSAPDNFHQSQTHERSVVQ
jgi:hypothetical protein